MRKKTEYTLLMVDALKGDCNCRIEYCTVRDNRRKNCYCMFIPDAMCDWFLNQISNGLLLGLVLAVLLRLQWEEIIGLTFDEVINCGEDGVYIPGMITVDGVAYRSGRSAKGNRLLMELVMERIAYLQNGYGYSAAEIFQLSVVCGDNP